MIKAFRNLKLLFLGSMLAVGLSVLSGCHSAPVYPLCKNDGHCKVGANGESLSGVCVNGTCQQCAVNSDCGEGQSCQANACVANNLPNKGSEFSDADQDMCALSGETVHFEFDQYDLNRKDMSRLDMVAKCLIEKKARVVLEGNTDERGSSEYNLALGQRRAEAVAKYLANNGVSKNSMKTISYGKERPVDTGSNEDAWSKNRRADIKTQ